MGWGGTSHCVNGTAIQHKVCALHLNYVRVIPFILGFTVYFFVPLALLCYCIRVRSNNRKLVTNDLIKIVCICVFNFMIL